MEAAAARAAEFDDEADEDGLSSRLARRLRQRPPPPPPPLAWLEDDTVVALLLLPPLNRRTRLRKVPLRDSDDFGASWPGGGGGAPRLLGSTLSAQVSLDMSASLPRHSSEASISSAFEVMLARAQRIVTD